jgi:hypothetical protein
MLRVRYPIKIPIVVLEGAHKTKYETLGCCGVSQLWMKMKHRVEAQEKEREMEDNLVVG